MIMRPAACLVLFAVTLGSNARAESVNLLAREDALERLNLPGLRAAVSYLTDEYGSAYPRGQQFLEKETLEEHLSVVFKGNFFQDLQRGI